MKNFKYLIIGLIAISSFLPSCENDEDFLSEDPKTIYTPETAFQKSSQVDAQLVTAYRKAFNMYGGYRMFWTGASTQQLLHGQGADFFDNVYTGAAAPTANAFSNYSRWSPDFPMFNNLWVDMYQLISYANLAIKGAELVEWSNETDKDFALGQARFFRGYGYLRLAECFGGVPIVQEVSESLKLNYTRDSRQAVYEFAIADLEAAEALLPMYPTQDGRLAKGVANHFIAEAYLALGVEKNDATNYDKAIAAASKTIAAHPLMTQRFGSRANPSDMSTKNGVPAYKEDGNVFFDLFQIGNYDYSAGNTEAVWTLEAATYEEAQANGLIGGWPSANPYYGLTAFVGPVFRNMVWRADLAEAGAAACPFGGNVDQSKFPGGATCAYLGGFSTGGTAETNYVANKVWAGDYANDMRNLPINLTREFLCLDRNHSLYLQPVTADMITVPEMMSPMRSKIKMDDWGWHSSEIPMHINQYGRDWYAVRSAETLLLRAEAYYRKGSSDMAAADINVIRNRAQATKLVSAGEVDIYLILDERARELCYEEHRFPTLLRMGSSSGSNEVLVHQLSNYSRFMGDIPYYTGSINWTLFPIPQTVINANTEGGLEQNPNWN